MLAGSTVVQVDVEPERLREPKTIEAADASKNGQPVQATTKVGLRTVEDRL